MTSRVRSNDRSLHDTEDSRLDQFVYIEVKITKETTLLSLSMKFNCTITDLKRLNSLQNDRDMYAFNTLKIPIKKHSTLAHQYETQLKFGDPNLSRLSENLVTDNGIEREIYKNSEEDDSEDQMSTIGTSSNKQNPYYNEESVQETHFASDIEILDVHDDTDETRTLIDSNFERTYNETVSSKKIVNDAKRFLKKKDKLLNTLKNKNEEITNNVNKSISLTDQLIPISNFSVESEQRQVHSGEWVNSSYLNIRDVLIVVCFLVILVPLSIFIYRLYYNEDV